MNESTFIMKVKATTVEETIRNIIDQFNSITSNLQKKWQKFLTLSTRSKKDLMLLLEKEFQEELRKAYSPFIIKTRWKHPNGSAIAYEATKTLAKDHAEKEKELRKRINENVLKNIKVLSKH